MTKQLEMAFDRALAKGDRDTAAELDAQALARIAIKYLGDGAGSILRRAAEIADEEASR